MAGTKELKVSADDVTYYTLPGNTGDINFEGNQLDDTIFGQEFSSSETGLISWTVSGNALYRGFAGYNSIIRRNSATSTSFTGETLAQVDSSKTYRITDSTKSVWNWKEDVTIYDNGVAVDESDIEQINYLFGEVTFVDTYTVTGPITADGEFFSMSTYGRASSFSLTQTAETTDTTSFEDAQANGGFNEYRATLLSADLELTGFYRSTNDNFGELSNRNEFVIELDVAGDGTSIARGIYKVGSASQSGDVGGDEESTLSLTLSVPEDVKPFGWQHSAASTIPQGLLVIQEGWINREPIYVKYLPEGEGKYGYTGQAIVTDASISSGVENMVEVTVSLQGTGTCYEIGTP